MNKRKLKKIIDKNMNIENNFGEINKRIDYTQYQNKTKKENKLISILLNKKFMAITCSILLLGICIPLLDLFGNPINSPNNQQIIEVSNSSNNSYNSFSNSLNSDYFESQIQSSMVTSGPDLPSSSEISNDNNYIVTENVYGIIKNDEENNKKFYTDSSYNSINNFKYTGYYNLDKSKLINYKLDNNQLIYEENSFVLGSDLPLDTKCYCKIVIEASNNSYYQVKDVYEIMRIL